MFTIYLQLGAVHTDAGLCIFGIGASQPHGLILINLVLLHVERASEASLGRFDMIRTNPPVAVERMDLALRLHAKPHSV